MSSPADLLLTPLLLYQWHHQQHRLLHPAVFAPVGLSIPRPGLNAAVHVFGWPLS